MIGFHTYVQKKMTIYHYDELLLSGKSLHL